MPLPGIDVSHHNGVIDWVQVARAGITFAYAKATEGKGYHDPQFTANTTHHQLPMGAYHFFRPLDPAPAQATNFLNRAVRLQLRPWLDVEWAYGPDGKGLDQWLQIPTVSQRKALIDQWCGAVYMSLAVKPIIYTSEEFLRERFGGVDGLAGHDLCLADYRSVEPVTPHLIWQHAQDGRVSGVTGMVDLDVTAADDLGLISTGA